MKQVFVRHRNFFFYALFVTIFLVFGCYACSSEDKSAAEPEGIESHFATNLLTGSAVNSLGFQAHVGLRLPNSQIFIHQGVGWTGLHLFLLDAPVDDAEAVFITVQELRAHSVESGWISLAIEPTTYNLLDLQNNNSVLLAANELPTGEYSSFRLMFDCTEENAPTIVIDGVEYPLIIPSGCETGVKIPYSLSLEDGVDTTLLMDFDARKSITLTGSNTYIMNPVIRVVDTTLAGNISGLVLPIGIGAVAYAFAEGTYHPHHPDPFAKAVNSTIIAEDGYFNLAALPAGFYDVVIAAEGFVTDISNIGIEVVAEEETVLPPLIMEPVE